MDFPFSLNERNLRKAVADRRYHDRMHPDSQAWRDMVSRGWATLYPDETLRGDHTDSLPRHQGEDGHIYASDGTMVVQASGGMVHVRDYTRMVNGQPVAVHAYDRNPPPAGTGGTTALGNEGQPFPGTENAGSTPISLSFGRTASGGMNLLEAGDEGGEDAGNDGGGGAPSGTPDDGGEDSPDSPGGDPEKASGSGTRDDPWITSGGTPWWVEDGSVHIGISPNPSDDQAGPSEAPPVDAAPPNSDSPSIETAPPSGPAESPPVSAAPGAGGSPGGTTPGSRAPGRGGSGRRDETQSLPPSAVPRPTGRGSQSRASGAAPRQSATGAPLAAPRQIRTHGNQTAGNAQTPPAWRAEVFRNQPGAWAGFNAAVRQLPQASETENFVYGQIYAAEGGNARDPRGSASSGILQRTLDHARARVPGLDGANTPSDLNAQQRAAIYRDYFDQAMRTVGGHEALNRVDNREAAAALADVLFRFGPGDGARIIQQAIESVAPGSIASIDGRMGPATLSAFNALVADAASLRALLDAIAVFRNQRTGDQEQDRNGHFRF